MCQRAHTEHHGLFAFLQHFRLAGNELVVVAMQHRHFVTVHPDIDRAGVLNGITRNGAGLHGIGRGKHLQVAKSAGNGDVIGTVVSSTQRPVGKAGVQAEHFDVGFGVANIVLHLFIRAGKQERRGVGGKHRAAAQCHSRRHADHILLGDTDVDHPIGKGFFKRRNF